MLHGLNSRSPLGLRGLKYGQNTASVCRFASQPTRAAWIEIVCKSKFTKNTGSQPTRAAWIEIIDISDAELALAVAAHSGCVD